MSKFRDVRYFWIVLLRDDRGGEYTLYAQTADLILADGTGCFQTRRQAREALKECRQNRYVGRVGQLSLTAEEL